MSVVDAVPTSVDISRIWRLLQYGAVGASGIPVDMAVVWLAFDGIGAHYLVAQVVAFAVAVSWNFSLNWLWTFDQPDGSLLRQFIGYVGIQLGALAARVGVVFALVELGGVPVLVASFIGIVLPALLGYLASERVFGVLS